MKTSIPGAIAYGNRAAFWLGVCAVVAGVSLQLPMYFDAAPMHYRLAGMMMGPLMLVGMCCVVGGLAATLYGLVPGAPKPLGGRRLRVETLDDAPLTSAHVGLLIVMAIAVTIDVMKPTNLAFVLPGYAREYGLRSPVNPGGHVPAAFLPLSGISGTVLGSFLWGWLGDRIGRRAAILMAAITFIATSACGAMTRWWMNVIMCFIMGLGVGGMLPLMFTMMAETIPARHRGWLMVLIGGDVAGAYICSSSLSAWLVPHYSWRILWLIGLPTGVLLILLNRWMPESPRYLLLHGRDDEARAVMARYGAVLVEEPRVGSERAEGRLADLLRPPFAWLTLSLVLLALGVGFVSFGFQLWIPSNLQRLGLGEAAASRVLRNAALMGFPLNFLVAWAYGFWSSKRTLVGLSLATAASLAGFMLLGDAAVRNERVLYALLIPPIWGVSSVVAVLSAYAAEVYPTAVRARGCGVAAGFSKAGGVLVIALVAAAIAAPSIAATAALGALPLGFAAFAVVACGVETRGKRLEQITAEELASEPAP